MSEREGRKFFFLLQAFLAALFLIVGVALAIEAASGGYGIGLVIVTVMANGPGLVFFFWRRCPLRQRCICGREAREPGHGMMSPIGIKLTSKVRQAMSEIGVTPDIV
jgi:hypothetical protein